MTVMAALVFTLAACGGSGDGESFDTALGDLPDCASIWVEGETLPDGYDGCAVSEDEPIGEAMYDCTTGEEMRVATLSEDSTAWVIGEGTIETGTEADWEVAWAECTAS